MKKTLVIVESPGKVKTIQSYLGAGFQVVATVGHIRQLVPKPKAVVISDGLELQWEQDEAKVAKLTTAISNAKTILLATDLDREGEAIAWHVSQIFQKPMKRMSFVEITPEAILAAIKNLRDINLDLVNAYLTRLALDHKIGFSISSLLLSKFRLLSNLSAGRVQSPTLSFIVQRELMRIKHKTKISYTIEGLFEHAGIKLEGTLIEPLETEKEKLEDIFAEIKALNPTFKVTSIVTKIIKLKPSFPFHTAALQQEAYAKLALSTDNTMKIAQKLYEGIKLESNLVTAKKTYAAGEQLALITYMRTDGTTLSQNALESIGEFLSINFPQFKSDKPNTYKTKVKNAQEAHEAIRPTNIFITPTMLENILSNEAHKLYKLIWQRTVASQMKQASREQKTIIIKFKHLAFKVVYSRIVEEGWMHLYGVADKLELGIVEGIELKLSDLKIVEHKTEPPARFTEGSLVKQMEEVGIGRPSTYATILNILGKRQYVRNINKSIVPTTKGEFVLYFLQSYLADYVNAELTAKMELLLDDISAGKINYLEVLQDFCTKLEIAVGNLKDIPISQILETIGQKLIEFFPETICCDKPMQLGVKYTFFLFCSSCSSIKKLEEEVVVKGEKQIIVNPNYTAILMGGKKVFLPQRFSANKENIESLSSKAVDWLFQLPIELFKYNNLPVIAAMSRFGFYIQYDNKYISLSLEEQMNFNEAALITKLANRENNIKKPIKSKSKDKK